MLKSLPQRTGSFYLFVIITALFVKVGQSQVFLENSSPYQYRTIEGGANWEPDTDSFVYDSNGTLTGNRAIFYSMDSFDSEDGFKLTIEYITGSIGDTGAHNFSFGLVSDETDLANYSGANPFKADESLYSLGINLTADGDEGARGFNYTNGSERITLDASGTREQFNTGAVTKVTMEIGIGGYWSYRINDQYEASGVLVDGIDLTKKYHVVVYGQDDNGGGKEVESILLEKRYAAGERAQKMRGTWNTGIRIELMDAISHLKTIDGIGIGFTDGASISAKHYAPSKLLESFSAGEGEVPAWGDLSQDEPQNDAFLANILKAKAEGFKIKAYTNSETFVGTNQAYLETFVQNFKDWCDTDPEAVAFVNSQPFHRGIWDSGNQEYVDASATYPNRKYMFCYAEFVLKDYALRYGKYFDNWIFDDGGTMEQNGDNATSGLIEEQRIYQAYSNAVHAGNPEVATAYNNGRSTVRYEGFPYAHPVRFEDFTFGHAFGGNGDHASKTGSQFNSNYRYVTGMAETDGYVFSNNGWDWDNKIVGNFHSKVSTTAWKYGPTQAWEQDDFNQWNLEAMQAGGAMTWDGSFNRGETFVYDWVIVLLTGLDNYLMEHESPGAPNWARYYTILPEATVGEAYSHNLVEGTDFWDPEGDEIIALTAIGGPEWLTIEETDGWYMDLKWYTHGI